jgi:hydroxypyruvate reductase
VHDHTHIKDPGALSKVTALIGTGAAKVDKKLLTMLPNVKLVAICGVGYDGVDVTACKDKGIVVTHTPGVLTDDVADLAMGLVLSIGRRIPQADKFVRNGDWVDDQFALVHKVSGARIGIVGMGRIGRAIAKRAAAFDMHISYSCRGAKAEVPYAFYKTATQLAAEVDYLVVAVPGGDETKNMIGASVLQALGSKGYLVNVARGSVVDQPVLVQVLKDKAIAGAALDVFWDEPIIDPELRRLPNVVLTPHIASATVETRQAMATLTLQNLESFYQKKPVPTPVPECN